MTSLVTTVLSVDWSLSKSNPPHLTVEAVGQASSAEWGKGTLQPRTYVAEPADGFQDFDFLTDPPAGGSLTVVSPISGTGAIEFQSWMKGICVHAKTNSGTVTF